ncbi:MAG TPA: exodeoxyribonuclease VII small subunit [Phycisphaerae bacterium]|nr:exodeoxyribonuclease VII small subunit [Phycisphaerae bacterium]
MAQKQPSFEEALKELEALADRIERGEIGLEDSIKQYEHGMKLVAHCRKILTRAEQRIEQLQPDRGGDEETSGKTEATDEAEG